MPSTQDKYMIAGAAVGAFVVAAVGAHDYFGNGQGLSAFSGERPIETTCLYGLFTMLSSAFGAEEGGRRYKRHQQVNSYNI